MQIIKYTINLFRLSLLTFTALGIYVFCKAQNLPFIPALNGQGMKEVRLGNSAYYILLPVVSPDTFKISEAGGREGQFGYDIFFKKSSSYNSFVIDILRGNPIGGNPYDSTEGKVLVESLLAGKKVQWRLAKTESGVYEVFTAESGDLNAHFWSEGQKDMNDINYVIAIIATLKRK